MPSSHDDAPEAAHGPLADSSRAVWLLAGAGIAVHVTVRLLLTLEGRTFASEDDPYRAYLAALLPQRDLAGLVGRFWLPLGQIILALVMRLGVPPAWAGPVLHAVMAPAFAAALATLAFDTAPARLRRAAASAAFALALASPLVLTLAQSSLSDLAGATLAVTAVAGLYRAVRTGRVRPLAIGAVALLGGTWVRYECWALALIFPAAAFVWHRRGGALRQAALARTLLASLPLLGPAGWMFAQWRVHGDPLLFLSATEEIVREFAPDSSRVGVLLSRLAAVGRWSLGPALLSFVAVASARELELGRAVRVSGLLAATALLPLLFGHAHPVFPDRLVLLVEAALVPMAALGTALIVSSPAVRGWLKVALLTCLLGLGALARLRPPELWDPDSVQAGEALRAGRLDSLLGTARLLIERPEKRPPFGWASCAVRWGRLDRVVFATPQPSHEPAWKLVEPRDVQHARVVVPDAELGSWLCRRGVRGAWTTTLHGRNRLLGVWRDARVLPLGSGAFLFPAGSVCPNAAASSPARSGVPVPP